MNNAIILHSGNKIQYFEYVSFMLKQLNKFTNIYVYILTTSNIYIPDYFIKMWKQIYENNKIIVVDEFLEIIGLTEEINDNNYTRMTFLKLLCPFIPELHKFNKLLYLDTDIVIMRDFVDIFDIDLKEHEIGCCIDYPMCYGCNINYTKTSLTNFTLKHLNKPYSSFSTTYFNCGVIMFNNKVLMEKIDDIKCRLLSMIKIHYQHHFQFADQDLINITFDCTELPDIYNKQRGHSPHCEDAVFLHFIAKKEDYNAIIKTYYKNNIL